MKAKALGYCTGQSCNAIFIEKVSDNDDASVLVKCIVLGDTDHVNRRNITGIERTRIAENIQKSSTSAVFNRNILEADEENLSFGNFTTVPYPAVRRKTVFEHVDRVKRIWYLSPMRAAKVQASLRIRAVSPEPSLLARTSSESRGTFRQKARSLAPLNGWACAVKICHDGMLGDTNSLDGAHIQREYLHSNLMQELPILKENDKKVTHRHRVRSGYVNNVHS